MDLTTIDSLQEELLEEILLRLPYLTLRDGKGVCKKWKQVMECDSFRRAYRGTVKFVFEHKYMERGCWFYILDGTRSLKKQYRLVVFGSTAHNTASLMTRFEIEAGDLYIGNVIRNEWEKVPDTDHLEGGRICIFGSGPSRQDHKVLLWGSCGTVMELVNGTGETPSSRLVWSMLKKSHLSSIRMYLPVILRNSMLCVGFDCDNRMLLVEYNVLDNRLSSKPIAIRENQTLVCDVPQAELVVWKEELYLVTTNEATPQVFQIWKISTGDGGATLVDQFESREVFMDTMNFLGMEDDEHIYVRGQARVAMTASITYNMKTKSVKEIACKEYVVVPRTLPVTLQ